MHRHVAVVVLSLCAIGGAAVLSSGCASEAQAAPVSELTSVSITCDTDGQAIACSTGYRAVLCENDDSGAAEVFFGGAGLSTTTGIRRGPSAPGGPDLAGDILLQAGLKCMTAAGTQAIACMCGR